MLKDWRYLYSICLLCMKPWVQCLTPDKQVLIAHTSHPSTWLRGKRIRNLRSSSTTKVPEVSLGYMKPLCSSNIQKKEYLGNQICPSYLDIFGNLQCKTQVTQSLSAFKSSLPVEESHHNNLYEMSLLNYF